MRFQLARGFQNEEPQLTAQRELLEETGYDAQQFREVQRYFPAVGFSDEELIVYHATGLTQRTMAREHGELVAPCVVSLQQLEDLVEQGIICDAKTLLALPLLREVASS